MTVYLAAYCLLVLTGVDEPARWPGFLGADYRSSSASYRLPLTWSPTENVKWTAATPGHGQSSPIVWETNIFLTAIEGELKDKNHVLCLSLDDGKERWRFTDSTSFPVKDSYFVSRGAPTPVCDAERVYAYFESGDIYALDHAGKLQWKKSLTKEYGAPQNRFGLAASPILYNETLIILVDDTGPSYLIGLDKNTGKVLWKTDRSSRQSWASPSLLTLGAEGVSDSKSAYVVISSEGSVDGYDPKTGQQVWTLDGFGGNTSATPIAAGAGFLVGASPGRNGEKSAEARRSNAFVTIDLVDGKPVPKVAWRSDKATCSFASPVVHAGYAYWVNQVGVIFCHDVKTGELKYSERTKQSCWAAPLGVGDSIYFFGKDGLTTVLAAGPTFRIKAENMLWEKKTPTDAEKKAAGAKEADQQRQRAAANFSGPIQYGTAAIPGHLLVRTGDRLYCIAE